MTEFSEVVLLFFPHPTSSSVRVVELVVVVGSCGGTDSGPYKLLPLSYHVFPLTLNVVNECARKASGQYFAGGGP